MPLMAGQLTRYVTGGMTHNKKQNTNAGDVSAYFRIKLQQRDKILKIDRLRGVPTGGASQQSCINNTIAN
jgi:hypothetical protein